MNKFRISDLDKLRDTYLDDFKQSLKTLDGESRSEIIKSISEEELNKKWQEIKNMYDKIQSIHDFNQVTKEIKELSQKLIDTINAPGRKRFIDGIKLWDSNKTYFNEEKINLLEKEIILHYNEFGEDFILASNAIFEIDELIKFKNINRSIKTSLLKRLKTSIQKSDTEIDNIDEEEDHLLVPYFSEVVELFDDIRSNDWLKYSEEDILSLFSDNKELLKESELHKQLYSIFDMSLGKKEFEEKKDEIQERGQELESVVKYINSNFNLDGETNDEKKIWVHWVNNLVESFKDTEKGFSETLVELFDELQEVITNFRKVKDKKSMEIESQLVTINENLSNVPTTISKKIQSFLDKQSKYVKDEPIQNIKSFKDFKKIKSWIKKQYSILKDNDLDWEEIIEEISIDIMNNLNKGEMHIADIEKFEANQAVQDIKEKYKEIKDMNDQIKQYSGIDFSDYIENIGTFYNIWKEFLKGFKEIMSLKLNHEENQFFSYISENPEARIEDIFSLLEDLNSGIEIVQNLYKYNLIKLTIKPTSYEKRK